jgi:low temperature requirement protein LtrA
VQASQAPSRVSTAELFFDLVFVFTITEVTGVIVSSPNGVGVARAAVALSVIFWMYGGFAWLTNTNAPDTLPGCRIVQSLCRPSHDQWGMRRPLGTSEP